jgi:hypothetical protein
MNTRASDSRCIFCEAEAGASTSVEHVVPESLGNSEHVLPAGVVCDVCNNYFARKIEGPLLQTSYVRTSRSLMWVPNKRGYVPSIRAVLPNRGWPIDLWFSGPVARFGSPDPQRLPEIERSILSGQTRTALVPVAPPPDPHLMSRFLGKVAIEAVAARTMSVDGWRSEIINNLSSLRRYVRRGDRPTNWEFSWRRLYPPDAIFDDGRERYQVLHEFDFVYTKAGSLLFALVLFGDEFAIDMGNASIAGYRKWLASHNNRSPLYRT